MTAPSIPAASDYLATEVDDLARELEEPTRRGLTAGYRIELVQWPPGHPGGIPAADFTDEP